MSDRELSAFNNTRISTSGNLAADPKDISRSEDGSVVVFNLIANRRDNNGDEFSDSFNCKSISPSMSENLLDSIRKGMAVEVEGKLEISYWEDRDGNERPQFGVLLDKVVLPLKYRSLSDHVEKFESEDDSEQQSRRAKGRGRRNSDDDDEEDDEEEETPRRSSRRGGASSRRSGGRSTSRRGASKGDDDEDEGTSKTRRSKRSTRARGDSEDEDEEI